MGPAWLDKLERRLPDRHFYAGTAVLAFLDGAMLSGIISRWLMLPGLAVALGLLWLLAVHTGQRLALTLTFFASAAVLFTIGLFLIQDRALSQRGEWVEGVVVAREQTRVNSTCELRKDDGAHISGPFGGCRGAQVGDQIRVFYDPEGEVPPSWIAPDVTLWVWLAIGVDVIFTACVLHTAVLGVGHQRQLQAAERAQALPSAGPPPPPPPTIS
ncbi:hypothetical protein [Streptomyces poriticola]|uniref:hypothetical protein n=1 Tax=Streptomyces poriticola TaxID=3120506 RepID=UPI002FCDEB1C